MKLPSIEITSFYMIIILKLSIKKLNLIPR